MMVDIALISGVMPRRRRPQISSGSVLSRPIRKKLTAISSMERVKISSAAPMIEQLQVRHGHAPEGLPVICSKVERSFFLRAIELLQSREHFGSRHRDERGSVAQNDRQQAELDVGSASKSISSERPVMIPGKINGSSTSRRNRAFAGKLCAIQRQRCRNAKCQRYRHGGECDLQAVEDGVPDRAIGKQHAVPVESEVMRRKSADSLSR